MTTYRVHAYECPQFDQTRRSGPCICKAISVYSLARRMAPDWSDPNPTTVPASESEANR